MKKNIIIMGAAGRDFHDFLTHYKNNPDYHVVCFTAEQILGIAHRTFPAVLAGKHYPRGIPIHEEKHLITLIKKHHVHEVVLSYSDLKHEDVMHKASLALAAGANFTLLSYHTTRLTSKKPIISVCAARTGCGKSQVSRKIVRILRRAGKRVVAIRHPMPYGDLTQQAVQRFATYDDLKQAHCTIEEREEYEPYINEGAIIYAGVDYAAILKQAEQEADIILWDGGNNDVPFYASNLHIVVLDPYRAGHELTYHPGEENFRLADAFIINKINSAPQQGVKLLINHIKQLEREQHRKIPVIKAKSTITLNNTISLNNKKVLVIEDGPTLTHGGMPIGAGEIIAQRKHARIIDPRPYAVGSIKQVYKKFTQLTNVLPAMGYSTKQLKDLQTTINSVPCEYVIDGSPVNIGRLIKIRKPIINVTYELDEQGTPDLKTLLKKKGWL